MEEEMNTCVILMKVSNTKSLKGETPYEKWNRRKLNIEHLRVFGSIVYRKLTGQLIKTEDQSRVFVFLGYEIGKKKSCRCINVVTYKVHVSQDVIYEE